MDQFLQTLLIAIIPSIITGVLSYLASYKSANTQIQTIKEQNKADIDKLKEQNKADIDKLIEKNKVDIEALKEKHKLELELKEKDHNYQVELIKIQHDNDLKKDEEAIKNQLAVGLFGNILTQDSPLTGMINDAISKGLKDAEK